MHAVLVCNEFRSESVHREFKRLFSGHFALRYVSVKHMHEDYHDDNIQLLLLSRRKAARADAVYPSAVHHTGTPGPARP